MKAAKIVGIACLVYIGIVVLFESMLGHFQPANQTTIVITTSDLDGTTHDRVVTRLESDGRLYIAANHWPRAWYRRILENPKVGVTLDAAKDPYLAVPVTGGEHDRVESDNGVGLAFRFLTGFPPRVFVRLDPLPLPANGT